MKLTKKDREWLKTLADGLDYAAECWEQGRKVFDIPPKEAITNIAKLLREAGTPAGKFPVLAKGTEASSRSSPDDVDGQEQ